MYYCLYRMEINYYYYKQAQIPNVMACHLQIDVDPDPDTAYHFDADPDPDFYLMWIWIQVRIQIRIHNTDTKKAKRVLLNNPLFLLSGENVHLFLRRGIITSVSNTTEDT
jgi:hypothetical protein